MPLRYRNRGSGDAFTGPLLCDFKLTTVVFVFKIFIYRKIFIKKKNNKEDQEGIGGMEKQHHLDSIRLA